MTMSLRQASPRGQNLLFMLLLTVKLTPGTCAYLKKQTQKPEAVTQPHAFTYFGRDSSFPKNLFLIPLTLPTNYKDCMMRVK